MARKVTQVVELVDDLGDGVADETVTFALDGTSYEIDLTKRNAARMREVLAEFVGNARKAGRGQGGGSGRRSGRRSPTGVDPAAVRAWARSHDIKVSERGRIPSNVVEQFVAAGN